MTVAPLASLTFIPLTSTTIDGPSNVISYVFHSPSGFSAASVFLNPTMSPSRSCPLASRRLAASPSSGMPQKP